MIYKDASYSVKERVEDLLGRMTLEEKAAQLCGNLAVAFIKDGKVSKDKLREIFPNGLGRITQYSLMGLVNAKQIAEITNEIQNYFVNETRLGIPVALQSENLCGYPGKGGTLFPSQLNVGSTWEPKLAGKMSKIIGQESRAVGITSAMSPVIDVSRDPRWGRTYETYGEDHYLISQMGIQYIKNMQEEGVSCIAKHFLGYGETQAGLNTATTRINDRELYEVFATPFEAADKEAKLDAVMANYAEIDGLPVIDNKRIARTLLRDTMGFEGMLTSDGAAVLKTFNYFRVAKTYEEAGLLAKKAGCDTEIPVGASFAILPKYVRSGELDESILDESVRRVLTIKFKRGLFENPYCEVEKLSEVLINKEKEALSKEIAAKSLILLKNDGILPLKKGRKLAVIGPHADNLRYPVSGYTYPAYIEMLDAARKGNKTVSFNGIVDEQNKSELMQDRPMENKPKGPFDSIFELYNSEDMDKLRNMTEVLREYNTKSLVETLSERFEVSYEKGCDITDEDCSGFDSAINIAKNSEVVIMAMGGNCGWVNVTGGEGKDRSKLGLPGVQQLLLDKIMELGKPVVLVLYGPGVFSVNEAKEKASAIIEAFMPGPFAGETVAEVLDGTINPGGKLSVTVPRREGQIPIFYNHKTGSGYATGGDSTISMIFSGGYTDGEADPLFHFGFGLSYTKFELSEMKVNVKEYYTDDEIEISCRIKNIGDRKGDEVVQLYASFTEAHVVRPNKQLVGFKRVCLESGEEKEIIFRLKTAQLAYYNENMEFVVEPGNLVLKIGNSSNNTPLEETVVLKGNKTNFMGKRSYTCNVECK